MKYVILAFLYRLVTADIQGREVEPGTSPWTPVIDTGLVRTTIDVSPMFASLGLVPSLHDVRIPRGWKAQIFFAGFPLDKPRFMAWGPDSVLFVANMDANNVIALPDRNRDGVADEYIIATTTSAKCHSIAFYRDTLYMRQEGGGTKCWRSAPNSDTHARHETAFST